MPLLQLLAKNVFAFFISAETTYWFKFNNKSNERMLPSPKNAKMALSFPFLIRNFQLWKWNDLYVPLAWVSLAALWTLYIFSNCLALYSTNLLGWLKHKKWFLWPIMEMKDTSLDAFFKKKTYRNEQFMHQKILASDDIFVILSFAARGQEMPSLTSISKYC